MESNEGRLKMEKFGHFGFGNKKFGPLWNKDGMLEVTSFSRYIPIAIEKDLLDAWPMVRSALEEYGISCAIDLVASVLTFSTTKTEDAADIIPKARGLLKLLSIGVLAPRALKVLNERQFIIIKIGCIDGGLCRNYGIKKEQFVERRKFLTSSPLHVLGELTGCDIFILEDVVAVTGSCLGLRIVEKIVKDCIVHKVPPTSGIRNFKMVCDRMNRETLD